MMNKKPEPKPKTKSVRLREIATKVKTLKEKLKEMREYKKILAQDGLEPDRDDKERESALIVQLLRLEKEEAMLEGKPPPRRTRKRGKFSGKPKSGGGRGTFKKSSGNKGPAKKPSGGQGTFKKTKKKAKP